MNQTGINDTPGHKGSWIIIFNDGTFVNVLCGTGTNVLSGSKIEAIRKHLNKKYVNSFIEFAEKDFTDTLLENRKNGLNSREWFVVDKRVLSKITFE